MEALGAKQLHIKPFPITRYPTAMTTQSPQPSLDDLRREIDAIDTEIHGLIRRRADIVGRLGAIKKAADPAAAQSTALRPGREISILRRLVADHSGPFPVASLLGLWRGMMTAFLSIQTPIAIRVFSGEKALYFWDLARIHFGAATPLAAEADTAAILDAVRHDPFTLGLLPPPQDNDWWVTLPNEDQRRIHVVAALPVFSNNTIRGAITPAYVVAQVAPELSGQDTVWIVAQGSERAAQPILDAATAAGLGDAVICAYKADADGRASHLIATDRSVDDCTAALPTLAAAVGGNAAIVGVFAKPIAL